MSIRDLIYDYTEDKSVISQGLAYYQLGKVQHIKINSVDHVVGSTLPYSSTIMADAEVDGEKPFLVMRGEHLLNFHCTCSDNTTTLC